MLTPIISMLLAYIAGIIAGKFLFISFTVISVISVLLVLFCFIYFRRVSFKFILLLFLMIGIFAFKYASLPPPESNIGNFITDKYISVIGEVVDEPRMSDDKTSFTIKTSKIVPGKKTYSTCGNIKIYLKGKRNDLKYGNKVQIKGFLSKIISVDNYGLLSYTQLMEGRGIYAQLNGKSDNLKILKKSLGNPLKRFTIFLKDKLFVSLRRTLKEPYSSLLGSIIFGSKASTLPEDIKENFRNAGVVHLLVVSGLHLSILLGTTASLLKRIGLSSIWRAILVSIFAVLYVIMAGAGASVIRAAIMAETALFTKIFQRENDFYNSLAFSAFILLIFNPLNIFAVGFQLSFLATWALFYVAPAIEDKLQGRLPGFFANLVSIAIAPALATTPIIFYNFGQVSFVSVFANMSIIPWIQYIVVLGFFSVLIGSIFWQISLVLNSFLLVILWALNSIVYFFSHLPFAYRFFIPPSFLIIIGYYLIFVWAVEILKGRMRFKFDKFRAVVAFLIIISIFVWSFAASAMSGATVAHKNELVITMIDVGQGDSILIESPSGKTMLIDGGGRRLAKGKNENIGSKIVIPYLRKRGINELDIVVLTHPHDDHVGGLVSVLKKIPVELVIDSGKKHNSFSYKEFLRIVKQKKIRYELGRAGKVIDLGCGVQGFIIYPTDHYIRGPDKNLNNASVVIKLVYKNFSMLLTGDLEHEGEEYILKQNLNLKSKVLKVGHHGSNTSTTDKFLKKVDPKYAVICVGAKNKFGHPKKTTIEKLKKLNIRIYRTDEDGAVMISTDGERMRIEAKRR